MGKFGNKRIPKFMMGEPIPESHEGRAIHPTILSLSGHGDDHAMIVIKTHDGQEVELKFDYDGDGMLTAQHGDHEYSIPVEVEIVSDMDELDEAKKGKPDYLDFDQDGDKKESMKKALQDKKKGKAAKTFESFVTECWNPMEEGYSSVMSEEAKQAIKKVCEDLLIKEAQMCDEDMDPMHTYETYLNECGSYMTECMMESAANLNVNESDEEEAARKYFPNRKLRSSDLAAKKAAMADFQKDPEFSNPHPREHYICRDCGAQHTSKTSQKKCSNCGADQQFIIKDPNMPSAELRARSRFADRNDSALGDMDQMHKYVMESTAYSCDTCGERAEHEEIEENPRMRCSNCGDRNWSPEY